MHARPCTRLLMLSRACMHPFSGRSGITVPFEKHAFPPSLSAEMWKAFGDVDAAAAMQAGGPSSGRGGSLHGELLPWDEDGGEDDDDDGGGSMADDDIGDTAAGAGSRSSNAATAGPPPVSARSDPRGAAVVSRTGSSTGGSGAAVARAPSGAAGGASTRGKLGEHTLAGKGGGPRTMDDEFMGGVW